MNLSYKQKVDPKKIDEFWKRRTKIKNQREATHFKTDRSHIYDLRFIRNFCRPDFEVLDMGCGNCYLSSKITEEVAWVTAIDKYKKFLNDCPKKEGLRTIQADARKYIKPKAYDLVLLFGVFTYFDYEDSITILQNALKSLKDNGKVLIKHACGVKEDVYIDNYSRQIGDDYQALYRYVGNDVSMILSVFSKVDVGVSTQIT